MGDWMQKTRFPEPENNPTGRWRSRPSNTRQSGGEDKFNFANGKEAGITEREREVLKLVAEEHSNREIADQLFLTVGTVKWYLTNLYSKLIIEIAGSVRGGGITAGPPPPPRRPRRTFWQWLRRAPRPPAITA